MAMRRATAFIGCVFGLLSPLFGQQAPSGPKKVTPEQQNYQDPVKQFWAERERLQVTAKQAFDAEMAQEKAGDCTDAGTGYDLNVCANKALAATNQNLKAYAGAIREILGLKMPDAGFPAHAGPDGMPTTPEQDVAEFDRIEQARRLYIDAVCTAAHHQYGGGTGGPSAELVCRVRLTRGHMKELDGIYKICCTSKPVHEMR
jgi:uncharacterized protein YecT (DUF1311 family)